MTAAVTTRTDESHQIVSAAPQSVFLTNSYVDR